MGRATFLETFAGVLDADGILEHCAVAHAPAVYAGWLQDEASRVWIVEAAQGGAPVGYAVLSAPGLPVADPSPGDLELKRIYLFSRFQGSGLGGRLMQLAAEEAAAMACTRLLLGVYARNSRAIQFYEKQGFVRVGERRFRVGRREYDDAVMARPL